MNQQKPITLIIDTKDGATFKGTYVSKDTQKLIIILSNVTKTFQGKDELLPSCEISKENIAKISMIDNRAIKEDVQNVNEIPENKKNEFNDNKLDNIGKAYDKKKDDFFDDLKLTTKDEMKKVANNYNLKNMDTFKLQKNDNDDEDDKNKRGSRGRRRGRGFGNKGGYRGNYGNKFNNQWNNNYYNFNNNYQQQKNKFNYGGYGDNYGNMNYQGYNHNNNNHRGRGGNFRNNKFNNRGGYNHNNNANFQNDFNKVENNNNNNQK